MNSTARTGEDRPAIGDHIEASRQRYRVAIGGDRMSDRQAEELVKEAPGQMHERLRGKSVWESVIEAFWNLTASREIPICKSV